MDNLSEIHVPSGPSSVPQDRAFLDKLTLKELMTRKDNTEAELKGLGTVLESHGVDMQTPLVDREGYPRADVDVAQIAVTRSRIIALRNDWKDLMDRIEKGLHEWHANYQASDAYKHPVETYTTSASQSVATLPSVPQTPFAKVDQVTSGSPAHEAGLKEGDQIRAFGSADWSNHERLKKVGEVVQRNIGKPILVKVLRGSGAEAQELSIHLTPRQGWGGRGLLGCHIV